MRSKWHFDTKCLLYHPEGLPPDELHPLVMKLQQSFDAMVVDISDLKQEVRILKKKLPPDPDPGDPSQHADLPTPLILAVHTEQALPEPDHTFAPMSLPDTSHHSEYIKELIAKGFKYAQSSAAFNFTDEMEEPPKRYS